MHKFRSPMSRKLFLIRAHETAPSPSEYIYARTNGRCWYCGVKVARRHMTRDHLIPLTSGGTNDVGNIVMACRPCNLQKAQMTLDEYRILVGPKAWGLMKFYGERDNGEQAL